MTKLDYSLLQSLVWMSEPVQCFSSRRNLQVASMVIPSFQNGYAHTLLMEIELSVPLALCNCLLLSGPDPQLLFKLGMKHFLEESEKEDLNITVKKNGYSSHLKTGANAINIQSGEKKKPEVDLKCLRHRTCRMQQSIIFILLFEK